MQLLELIAPIYKIIIETIDAEESMIPIRPSQAEGIADSLLSLGIDPETVLVQEEEENPLNESEPAVAFPSEDDPRSSQVKIKNPTPKKGKFFLKVSPDAVNAAKRFFEMGKVGANWYYDANNALNKAFKNEDDKVLFALLLAITSVQNEVYGNFIEAIALYKAIKTDMATNPELLKQFSEGGALKGQFLDDPLNSNLNILQTTKTMKIMNVQAKFGNIKAILKKMFSGQLKKEDVTKAIASSVAPGEKSFNKRNPLIKRLKIANYALTLLDPEFANSDQNPFNVVVDSWMFRAFFPKQLPQDKSSGKSLKTLKSLFSSDRAYETITNTVSNLAKEAGVSPHVMQAAIWTGIKKQWEGDKADTANYVQAINRFIDEYSALWKDLSEEVSGMEGFGDVIDKLDIEGLSKVLRNQRGERLRGIVVGNMAKRNAKEEKEERTAIQGELEPNLDTSFNYGAEKTKS